MRDILQKLSLPPVLCVALLTACSDPVPEPTDGAADIDPEQSSVAVAPGAGSIFRKPLESPEPVTGTASYREQSDISEEELGVPLYPDARRVTGGAWSLTDSQSEGAESLLSIQLQTTDDIEKVAAFYRQRMQPDAQQIFELRGVKGRTISLTTDTEGRSSSNVVLRQNETGTRIDISVMGAKRDKDS